MSQEFYIVEFAIKQMDQESLWEKFLDGIYGALCLTDFSASVLRTTFVV